MPEQSFDTQCGHCHTVEHFHIGHDSTETSIEKVVKHLQGKTQIQIRSIIRKHQIDLAEYGFALYACPKCQTLYNPFDVKIEYDQIMLFQPFYKCDQCNATLKKATEDISAYACKKCGQKQLTSTPIR